MSADETGAGVRVGAAAPRVLLTGEQIEGVVARLAAELSQCYGDGLVLVGVLRGSVPFLADLVRAMSVGVAVDFVAITPY